MGSADRSAERPAKKPFAGTFPGRRKFLFSKFTLPLALSSAYRSLAGHNQPKDCVLFSMLKLDNDTVFGCIYPLTQ